MRSLKPNNPMQFNRLTLAFRGRHAHLEGPFQEYLFDRYLRALRLGLVLAVVIFCIFGFYDKLLLPQKAPVIWTIRFAIFCPLLTLLFALTFSKHFKRIMEPAITSTIIFGGTCMVVMILTAQSANCFTYSNGLVQVLFFIHAVLKLRIIWRTPATWCLVGIYISMALFTGITPREVLIADMFNLICINTIGTIASHIIEYNTRRNFYLSRQLESKKRRLAVANEYLEDRVTKRTADLSRTNKRLKDEIHERKAAEGALRKSEKRFRRMVDNVSDYMCVHDLNGNILDANQQMIKGLGYSRSKLKKMNLKSLVIPEQQTNFDHQVSILRQEGRRLGKMTMLTKGGQQRHFEYSSVLAEHTSGRQVVYSLARDITRHKRAEKALAESQANFKSIFETAAAGMMIVNAQTGNVVGVNPAAADMVDTKIDLIKGMPIDELIHLTGKSGNNTIDSATSHPIECELISRTQTRIPILKTTQTTVLNEQPHWIISFVNMQKIKEAEEAKRTVEKRLNQAQHLQSIGTLAGGIAHDFNNVLYGMMGYTELALDDAPKDSMQAANLKEALQGGQRAKEMINQILTFSRQNNDKTDEKQTLQPVGLIKEALKLLRATIPTTIKIKTHFKDQFSWIEANPAQLHQVIMNLCTNAAHAMSKQGGCLGIELDNVTVKSEMVMPHGKISKGKYVCIRVSDTGTGIAPDVAHRIFDPFFTTKPQGEGTGMGLSVTLGIVQSHGGNIQVHSRPGEGSRFDILLPFMGTSEESVKKHSPTMPGADAPLLSMTDIKN